MADSSTSRRFAVAVSFPGEHRRFVRNVVDRLATTTLGWAKQFGSLLTIALDHLTLARVGLIRGIVEAGLKSGPGIGEGEAPAEPRTVGIHGLAGASPSRSPGSPQG